MKKLAIVTPNNRLQSSWKELFLTKYDVVTTNSFDQVRHMINPEDLVILHDDTPLERLQRELDSINAFLEPNKVLILRTIPNIQEGETLLQKAIGGYGNVNMNAPVLRQAVDVIQGGSVWLYPQLLNDIIQKVNHLNTNHSQEDLGALTKREKEVALLVAKGESNQMIAKHLNISSNTVKLHLTSIFHKLDIKSRVALAVKVGQP